MAKKENQRILLTKRLLQEGLLNLLETKALDKISVTELCRESGINRATFYNHYNSPHDLLQDLGHQMIHDLQSITNNPKTVEELSQQLEAACSYLKEHARSLITLSRCHADEDLADVFNRISSNFHHQYLRDKQSRLMDADSYHLACTYMYTGAYHLIREWLIKDIQKTPKEIADLLIRIISNEFI